MWVSKLCSVLFLLGLKKLCETQVLNIENRNGPKLKPWGTPLIRKAVRIVVGSGIGKRDNSQISLEPVQGSSTNTVDLYTKFTWLPKCRTKLASFNPTHHYLPYRCIGLFLLIYNTDQNEAVWDLLSSIINIVMLLQCLNWTELI